MSTINPSEKLLLRGKRILVTRPRHQAESLCSMIEHSGGQVLRFPLLEIEELEDITKPVSLIEDLEDFEIAIFISPNAVTKTFNLITRYRLSFPPHIKIGAIGKKTMQALHRLGHRVDIAPQQSFNSEAFLVLPQVQNLFGQRIIIFRGVGGREHLGNTLVSRGARVEYAEIYRRIKPKLIDPQIKQSITERNIDLVTITSSEALQNLHELNVENGINGFFDIHLLVGSYRMAAKAKDLGFSKVSVARDPTDVTMYNAILKWAKIEGRDP
ncbi:MAG: uroporphyrinogen-III synthase [Pseudomonadota bacterium]